MSTDQAVSGANQGNSEKFLTFPRGIPGFEKYTKYILFHKEENNISAYWLESCAMPKVTFTLVDPRQYGLSYELELTEDEQQLLQIDVVENLGIFLILKKTEESETAASGLNANISGPIIINLESRLGLQKVLQKSHVKAQIVEE